MDTPMPADALETCLNGFAAAVNSNKRMLTMLKGWEPDVRIEASDSGKQYHFTVRGCRIDAIGAGEPQGNPHVVHLRASEDVFIDVFSGKLNPATAYLKGMLEVYGGTADQVKLDTICLVLWGL